MDNPTHRASYGLFRRPQAKPTLLVALCALLALMVWTLPNLGEFWRNVGAFPMLWQVEVNRQAIISLVVKVFSPLILAFLSAACCWLWYTIKPFVATTGKQEGPPPANQSRPPAPPSSPQVYRTGPFPPPVPSSPVNGEPSFTVLPTAMHNAAVAPTLPITPIPPFLEDDRQGEGFETVEESGEEQDGKPDDLLREQEQADAASSVAVASPLSSADATSVTGEKPIYVIINLLGEACMTLQTPDGALTMPVPLSGNTKRVQLLAYLAWRQGEMVNRDTMLEQIFGHGKPDEQARPRQLSDAFDSHRKFIRQDLRAAIEKMNAQAGRDVIPPDLDIFVKGNKLWGLADVCRVADLAHVEQLHRQIAQAEDDGLLANTVPEDVMAACTALLKAYKGDFLAHLLDNFAAEFDPWQDSWVRKPFTLYRDYYFDALLYAAGYELQQGQATISGGASEERELEQRAHYDRAARHYKTYATRAVSSKYDLKLRFSRSGREHGERVVMSERALRRAIMLYGAMDMTHMVDKLWATYSRYMTTFSGETWHPSVETLKDLEAARSRTSAYRLSTQMTPAGPFPQRLETAGRS